MKPRLASKSDLPTLKNLWYECFLEHDSQESIDYYFENKFILENTFVLEVNDEIVTSLQLNQHDLVYNNKIEPVSFVVGVATFKIHRQKGYMRVLLDYAIEYAKKEYKQNYMILQAYDWAVYRSFGFEEAYYKYRSNLEISDLNNIETTELLEYDDSKMLAIYQDYTKKLNGYKKRDLSYFKELKESATIDNIEVALSNDSYVYYKKVNGVLDISECAYTNFNDVLMIIKTLVTADITSVTLVSDLVNYDKHFEGQKELDMMVLNLNKNKFEISENLYISEVI